MDLVIQEIQAVLVVMETEVPQVMLVITLVPAVKVAVVAAVAVLDHSLTLVTAQVILGQDHYHSTPVLVITAVQDNRAVQYKVLEVVLVVLEDTAADITEVGVVTVRMVNQETLVETDLVLDQATQDIPDLQETQVHLAVQQIF